MSKHIHIDTLLSDYNQTRDQIAQLQLLLKRKRDQIAKRLVKGFEDDGWRYVPYAVAKTKVNGYTRSGYRAFRLTAKNGAV